MRGYFGIGVESISKPYNVGNLFRSGHAFGANFVFTVRADYQRRQVSRTDTSDSLSALPYYQFPEPKDLILPQGCKLVGVELMDDAVDLPSFRHPLRAAYVMGPERGSLSPEMLERCDYTIKIPTKFCLNVGIAGVVVMYDRMMSRGSFAPRPVRAGGPTEGKPEHRRGGPLRRAPTGCASIPCAMDPFRADPPLGEVELAETAGD